MKRGKELWPIMKLAKKQDSPEKPMKARYKLDGLEINGKLYTKKNARELPLELNPEKVCTPMNDNTVLFFTKSSPFSNHFACDFTYEGIKYNCGEQFIMSQKAKLFGDQQKLSEIMKEVNPQKQKRLGKQISHFDKQRWRKEAYKLILPGIQAKFKQNKTAQYLLKDTGNRQIAEANPHDQFFGIGMGLDNPDAWLPENWSPGGTLWGIC